MHSSIKVFWLIHKHNKNGIVVKNLFGFGLLTTNTPRQIIDIELQLIFKYFTIESVDTHSLRCTALVCLSVEREASVSEPLGSGDHVVGEVLERRHAVHVLAFV